jgi:PAS domain S-box-containing protein
VRLEQHWPTSERRYEIVLARAPEGVLVIWRVVGDREQRIDVERESDGCAATIAAVDERVQRAAVASGTLVYDADPRSGTAAVHGFHEFTGFHPRADSADFWHSRIHPDDLAEHLEELDLQSKTGGVRRIRYRFQHATGRWLQVEDTREVVLGADGSAVRIIGVIVDETERMHAETAIRQSEAEYRSLFENTGVANAEIDATTLRFIRVNRRYCELLGYGAEELVGGMTILDVTYPDDREHDGSFANGIVEITKRYLRRDRSTVWVHLTRTPLRDPDGQITRLLVSAIDVTTNIEAMDAVRSAAEQLRFVTDHATVQIVQCDSTGRYTFVNAPYADRHGLTPEQAVGKHISEVVSEEAYAAFRDHVEAALRGERAEFEQEIPYPFGRRWMRCTYVPDRDATGRVTGFVALIQDETERHTAQEALRRSEGALRDRNLLLQLALEASPAIVFEWDVRRNRARRIVSALEELPASDEWEPLDSIVRRVHSEDRTAFRANLADAIASENGSYRSEFRVVLPDGDERWLEEHGYVERNALNRPERMIGISRDITARKQIEQGLKDELRTNEMFVGVLSHDLRNPIAGSLMVAELGAENTEVPGTKKSFERIAQSAKRMLRLIEQLLDLTRFRMAHGIELRLESSDLGHISGAVVDEWSSANPEADVRLEVLGSATGRWDPDRLAQLVSNLVGNAIQHRTGPGRVAIHVDGSDENVVRLRVTNDGSIPREVMPVLFEPFKRGASATKKKTSLGLGLYIVKQVALAHGGDVQARSDPEHGTTFETVLPREAEQRGTAPRKAREEPIHSAPDSSAR